MEKQLFTKIDSLLDYALELETGLTAIPAVTPDAGGEGELDKTLYLEQEVKKLKFDELTRVDAPDSRAKGGIRPNLVARYKGVNSAKTLWIMAHTDIVPPGELSLWSGDPYTLRREGDKIIGRGVEDNQQGLVAGIVCLRAMMELGVRPPCDVALLFNADEETGSKYGAEYVLKTKPELFGKNDVFIVPDGGTSDGSMVEVHPRPDEAKSDGEQSLTLDQFADMAGALNQIHEQVRTLTKDPFAMTGPVKVGGSSKH